MTNDSLRSQQGKKVQWEGFQLFVGVFDTCLVWYLLVLSFGAHVAANMASLSAVDGDTSYHSSESLSLHKDGLCSSGSQSDLPGRARSEFSLAGKQTSRGAASPSCPAARRSRLSEIRSKILNYGLVGYSWFCALCE